MPLPILVLAGLIAGSVAGLPPNTGDFPRGELVDGVVSASDPTQRYVVYLPKGGPDTPRPILYVMDYRGRGRVAAEQFRPAAERFGWIVMSSYNTASDAAGLPNAQALKAMWTDSHDRFAIDDRRTYVAGLSGTARMATLFAAGTGGAITGVIGAAAGFSPDMPPTERSVSFLYYGTAGTVDYNYWEMRGLDAQLSRMGKPHRIAFFDGPHAWMPPELAMAALAWMELRAMRAGQRPIDRGLVEERWTRDRERVQMLEDRGKLWEASQLLKSMADDYTTLRPSDEVAELVARAERLARTPQATDQSRRLVKEAEEHDRNVHRRLQVLAAAYPANADEPVAPVKHAVWNLDIPTLRETARGTSDEALAAGRVLAQLFVQTGFYLPTEALAKGDVERARYYLGIAEAIDPDDAHSWYLRAAVEARSKQYERSIAALKRALALGYRTTDALENEAAFTAMRDRPDFRALVEEARQPR
jgi:tetratricopeptide (TPR) repeat protein